jgi:hypothetical protein
MLIYRVLGGQVTSVTAVDLSRPWHGPGRGGCVRESEAHRQDPRHRGASDHCRSRSSAVQSGRSGLDVARLGHLAPGWPFQGSVVDRILGLAGQGCLTGCFCWAPGAVASVGSVFPASMGREIKARRPGIGGFWGDTRSTVSTPASGGSRWRTRRAEAPG